MPIGYNKAIVTTKTTAEIMTKYDNVGGKRRKTEEERNDNFKIRVKTRRQKEKMMMMMRCIVQIQDEQRFRYTIHAGVP